MSQEPPAFSRTLVVRPEPARLAEIRQFIEAVCNKAGLSPERTFDLKVAVSEACANAVEHSGNRDEPLEIRARHRRGRLTIDICDRGGFRLPCFGNGQERNHRGLGFPLMVALTDEIHISKVPGGGTRVTLGISLAQQDGKSTVPQPVTRPVF